MNRKTLHTATVAGALLALATAAAPASAQYRARPRTQPVAFTVTPSVGYRFGFDETAEPAGTTDPLNVRELRRSFPGMPLLGLQVRWGSTLQLYASGSWSPGVDVDVSGNDPVTGAQVSGSRHAAATTSLSAGLSFLPIGSYPKFRLVGGVDWLRVGDGGRYVGLRVGAYMGVWDLGEHAALEVGGEVDFAGGSTTRDGVEYQLGNGAAGALRLGLNLHP